MKFKHYLSLLVLLFVSACVTVEPAKPIVVSGAAGFLDERPLPRDSVITIAIIDFDTPGAILAQKSFNVAVQPVPFKFSLQPDTLDANANYGVVAHIESQGRIIYQTYDRVSVITNDQYTAEVVMKPAR
ncbi:YbaY family lipoprotein [Paraferrimonas sedimenticola]|uniref:Chaperone for general secretion pathway YbaY n=1 Tax=Paraferrimonas sedimenticola TaxID=375674 RepID=A0AA37RUG2_9GAMM|nr:YbaY family lipoprotein [Paraferrimonas sedimenticola]GLP94732.1 chaperone for general secretion pathway YbaY [Paraferrimonas sedimenticola]